MSEHDNCPLPSILGSKLPEVKHATDFNQEFVDQLPYSLRFYLRRHGVDLRDAVVMARALAHGLDNGSGFKHTYCSEFFTELNQTLDQLGFVRHDLDDHTLRTWWMYYKITPAPHDWFDKIYESQPNLEFDFFEKVIGAILEAHHWDESKAEEFERCFGLFYDETTDAYVEPTFCRLDSIRYHLVAEALPVYMGLGGIGLRQIDQLLYQLSELFTQCCISETKADFYRHELLDLAKMDYGPNLDELQQAYRQPLSDLWLKPQLYDQLWSLGIRSVGDIIANRQQLIDNCLSPQNNAQNRLVLAELAHSLRQLGYDVFDRAELDALSEDYRD